MSRAQYTEAMTQAKANLAAAQADKSCSHLRKGWYVQTVIDLKAIEKHIR